MSLPVRVLEQALQPVHAVAQQKPSTQWPLVHCVSAVQVEPLGRIVWASMPSVAVGASSLDVEPPLPPVAVGTSKEEVVAPLPPVAMGTSGEEVVPPLPPVAIGTSNEEVVPPLPPVAMGTSNEEVEPPFPPVATGPSSEEVVPPLPPVAMGPSSEEVEPPLPLGRSVLPSIEAAGLVSVPSGLPSSCGVPGTQVPAVVEQK